MHEKDFWNITKYFLVCRKKSQQIDDWKCFLGTALTVSMKFESEIALMAPTT